MSLRAWSARYAMDRMITVAPNDRHSVMDVDGWPRVIAAVELPVLDVDLRRETARRVLRSMSVPLPLGSWRCSWGRWDGHSLNVRCLVTISVPCNPRAIRGRGQRQPCVLEITLRRRSAVGGGWLASQAYSGVRFPSSAPSKKPNPEATSPTRVSTVLSLPSCNQAAGADESAVPCYPPWASSLVGA